jgi:O-antigen/teichoic acid export membrane protein
VIRPAVSPRPSWRPSGITPGGYRGVPARLATAGAILIRGRAWRNTLWLAAGDGSGKLMLFAVNLYLARVLRPSAYGSFVVAQALIYYAWHATDLGTTMHGIRAVARNPWHAQRIVSSLSGLRAAAGAAGLTVTLAIVWAWPLMPGTRLVFSGACLYLISRAVYPDYVLRGLEKFRALALGSLSGGLTFLVVSLALVHGPSGAPYAAFGWSCSWFAGAAVLTAWLRRRIGLRPAPAFRPRSWLGSLRQSWQFAATGGLTLLYDTLPILLAAAVFGGARSGLFSATYKLVISLTGVGYLIPAALYPVLAQRHAHDLAAFVRTHRLLRNVMLTGALLAAAGGMIFARPIMGLTLGSHYTAATAVFRILAADLVCYAIRFSYGTALGASGNQKYYTIVSLIGLAVLGITFPPAARLGLPGEALCVVLADASVAAGLAVTLRRAMAADPRRCHLPVPSGPAS